MATINGTPGNDSIVGTAGDDTIFGGAGNDTVLGAGGNDVVQGNDGVDWVEGGTGNDTLSGGSGTDTFAFREAGAANADVVTDFASNWDDIRLDAAGFAAIGATGRFAASDVRFFAGAGATGGHDADDRIIYNSTTGQLFYDPDGNGAAPAQLIATLNSAPIASDIWVFGTATPPPPPPSGSVINGTAGNDSLVGGPGNDTINGLAGDDTIDGAAGNDLLDGGSGNDIVRGGDGNDTLIGGWNNDTLDGGAGQDTLLLADARSDVTVNLATGTMTGGDPGGTASALISNIESVDAGGLFWHINMTGSAGDDVLRGGTQADTIMGGAGNDTIYGSASGSRSDGDRLFGGDGNDLITIFDGNGGVLDGGTGNDTLSGGTGQDTFEFSAPLSAANADTIVGFQGWDFIALDANVMPALGPSGSFSSNDVRFYSAPGATSGHDADDRVVYDSASGKLYYDPDGNGAAPGQLIATLLPVSGANPPALTAGNLVVLNGTTGAGFVINGTSGNDSLTGTDGNDTINGLGGNDTLDGGPGNDRLDGGAGDDSIVGGPGADFMIGGDGNDTLDGGNARTFNSDPDIDTMDGGLGNDLYIVDNAGDVLFDAGGTDTVIAHNVDWTLGAGFENLTLRNDSDVAIRGTGNELDNVIRANWISILDGRGGNDTLIGSAKSDRLFGGDGNDSLDGGGQGFDILDGGNGDDTLLGNAIGDVTLTGGAGSDSFIFAATGNLNQITDFASGTDKIHLDARAMSALGASGNFAAGDPRFFAAAGATGGHDADDRVVYDTSTGKLWYDADGNGAGAAQLIATVNNAGVAAGLAATDIAVDNGSAPAAGQTINGTPGNDSLVGGAGNDTINGFAGNDTIDGGAGADSMIGGAGDDLYFVDNAGDQVVELANEGIDEVRASVSYTLSDFVNNLTLVGSAVNGTGNAIDNVITGNALNNTLSGLDGNDVLNGGAGNDTLNGGPGADSFIFNQTPGVANADQITDFTSGTDKIRLDGTVMTQIGASGNFAAGDVRFFAAAGATGGHDADDRIVYNTTTGQLFYDADGNGSGSAQLIATLQAGATLAATDIAVDNGTVAPPPPPPPPGPGVLINGTAGNDSLVGGSGNDTINGFAGNDTIVGGAGNDALDGNDGVDWLEGGAGNDTLTGGSGTDSFVFREAGAANADVLTDFATNWDDLRFDAAGFAGIGAAGRFAAGDARFYAAAGATGGHTADDRFVFNTSTGQLYYDDDGSGAHAAQLVLTLQAGAALTATDISVI